jgi:hypothetical protein
MFFSERAFCICSENSSREISKAGEIWGSFFIISYETLREDGVEDGIELTKVIIALILYIFLLKSREK